MALEDCGVKKEALIELHEKAKATIYLSSDSLGNFTKQPRDHHMGGQYHLAFILEHLNNLGLDYKDGINQTAIGKPFFESLLRDAMNHSLREVTFKARVPFPKSYQLVGVADEGRAYIDEGLKEEDVFTLKPGFIYGQFHLGSIDLSAYSRRYLACVQESAHENPVYLKGACVISRSPVIHPGDGEFAVSILLKTLCGSYFSYSPNCLHCW